LKKGNLQRNQKWPQLNFGYQSGKRRRSIRAFSRLTQSQKCLLQRLTHSAIRLLQNKTLVLI
jgi:hypothetical protein